MRTFAVPRTEGVHYGPGTFDALGDLAAKHGGTRTLVLMSNSLTGTWVEESVRAQLGGSLVGIFSKTPQHVPRSAVLEATAAAREARVNCLVSVGGGTPIDCAKAVSMAVACDVREPADLDHYRVRFTYPDRHEVPALPDVLIPHIAVPTTLSAGEHTPLTGVTNELTHTKDAFRGPGLVPVEILLDPSVSALTPGWLWAASGVRAVDHAVESILSRKSMPMSEALGQGALRLLSENLVHSVRNPDDAEARTACLLASWMSISTALHVGMGLSHGIGHQLAAEFDFTHGVTSAIMLPHVMDFSAPVCAPQLRGIAEAMGRDTRGMPDADAATAASTAVRELVAALGVESTISGAGGRRDALPAVASRAIEDAAVAGSARPVGVDDLVALLEAAW